MKEQDIEDLCTKIDGATNEVAATVQAGRDEIAALKAQIAAGTPVTQEQLDAIGTRLGGVVTRLQAIAADPADPVPAA